MSSLFSVATATAFGGHQNRNGGYKIQRSVRLRASAGYLNRTLSASGSTSQWTYSVWTKRGTLGSFNVLLSSAISAATYVQSVLAFDSSDRLWYYQFSNAASYTVNVTSTAVFRDPSAWYHVVMKFDATTSSMIVWVNNQEVINSSSFSTTYRLINSNNVHYIGNYAYQTVDPGRYDGYMTEINFIDGQALTPASFGETDSYTGVWRAKRYTGTYGTNGFYLNFSDNSAATAAAIGKDYSGLGNNWTPNNISVTAGVTYDSMLDVPTQWGDGGNGRGNYAIANPVNAASGLTVNDGNLKIAASAGGSKFVNSSIPFPSSGAYYAEITCGNATTNLIGQSIGIQAASRGLTSAQNAAGSFHFYGTNAGILVSNATTTASGLSAISANEVFQVAIDVTNSKMWIGRSNVWYNSTGGTTGNPATGANPTFTAAFADYFIYSGFDTGSAVSANLNFGQRPFDYTPPSGFKALNTLNLP